MPMRQRWINQRAGDPRSEDLKENQSLEDLNLRAFCLGGKYDQDYFSIYHRPGMGILL